ncbi:hypothetical protein A1Q2_03332 [Trichosporon asahii var. asahii CBS 8904]|uniref:Uncharacterized protein n=1 Tax=Trichosporon asahii var. asahii (strain CBS 8904) TaxID=1220162 RepID=K1VP07_TRIAC|nr:hypothetical protein A1Q2_03332 [Trichosporon asahii var. asahii CBS 8904]
MHPKLSTSPFVSAPDVAGRDRIDQTGNCWSLQRLVLSGRNVTTVPRVLPQTSLSAGGAVHVGTSFSGGDGILQGSVSARRSAAHQNGRHQGCKDQGRHSMQNVLGAGHSSMLVVAERRISSVMARSASRASGTPSDRRGRHRVPRRKSPAGDGPTATVTFHSFIVSDPCRPSTSPTGCSSGAGDHRAMHVPVDEQLGMLPLGALLSSEERRWLPTLRFKLLHRTNAAAGW